MIPVTRLFPPPFAELQAHLEAAAGRLSAKGDIDEICHTLLEGPWSSA